MGNRNQFEDRKKKRVNSSLWLWGGDSLGPCGKNWSNEINRKGVVQGDTLDVEVKRNSPKERGKARCKTPGKVDSPKRRHLEI